MLNNFFIVKVVAKYLDENISGLKIKEIFTQEKNKLLIELSDEKIFEFSIEKDFNYLLEKEKFSKSKKNNVSLFEEIYEEKILSTKLFNDDRIIEFEFKDTKKLLFTFFSSKANCFLIDNFLVINCYKDRNEFYKKNISELFAKKIKSKSKNENSLTPKNFLKNNYREFGDLYLEEILFRSKVREEEIISDEIKSKLIREIDEMKNELKRPKYFLYSNNLKKYISLIELKHLKNFEKQEFENINKLLVPYLRTKYREDKVEILKQNRVSELKKRIESIDKKIKGLKIQEEHCEDSSKFREFGNTILQNLNIIKKREKKFIAKDSFGIDLEIKLKEELSPSENAQNYFEKYKKQKSSIELLNSKIKRAKSEKINLESELMNTEKMEDYKSLMKEEKKSKENKKDVTSKFRKFKLNEKYEVWVGKDSASNDMLTTKYASQNDLWFHVRGASGSHTVLKVGNKKEDVGKEIVNRAASIAAYYSKARNASSVPVAYTEKKYVKKKKGFKEGSVVMEREKVIFVKPALPQN